MFWPVDEEDWMSFTPGTWTTEELRETTSLLSPGDPSPATRVPGPPVQSHVRPLSVRPSLQGSTSRDKKAPSPSPLHSASLAPAESPLLSLPRGPDPTRVSLAPRRRF